MKLIALSCIFTAASVLCSCSCSIRSNQNDDDSTSGCYKTKAKVLETFINIDYDSAYENAVKQTDNYQTLESDIMSLHSEYSTPWMLYLSATDCSLCIVAALDFMLSFCNLCTDFETPTIVLKNGDKEIFDFYREKQLSQINDITNIEKFQKFHVFNMHSDYIENFKDGIYLIYQNRIINYMNWPATMQSDDYIAMGIVL